MSLGNFCCLKVEGCVADSSEITWDSQRIRDPFLRGANNKNCDVLGSTLGSLLFQHF